MRSGFNDAAHVIEMHFDKATQSFVSSAISSEIENVDSQLNELRNLQQTRSDLFQKPARSVGRDQGAYQKYSLNRERIRFIGSRFLGIQEITCRASLYIEKMDVLAAAETSRRKYIFVKGAEHGTGSLVAHCQFIQAVLLPRAGEISDAPYYTPGVPSVRAIISMRY